MVREIGGFPDRVRVQLPTTGTGVGFGTNSTPAGGFYEGISSPKTVGTPLGWAQYASVYDIFVVHSAAIEVTFNNLSTTVPVRALVVPYDIDKVGSFPLSVDDSLCQTSLATLTHLGVLNSGKSVMTIKKRVTIAKLSGAKSITLQSADFVSYTGGSNSTNVYAAPVNVFRWWIGAQTVNGTNLATNIIYCDFKVVFDIEFGMKLPQY
jgi:hypothetical protein